MAEDYAAPDWRGLCSRMADALDHNRQCLLDDRSLTHPLADKARAALARWGGPAPAPAEGEVAELAVFLRGCADDHHGHGRRQFTRAADLLERQAAPVPVAVSERLPGPEDCDAEGRCWVGHWCDVDGDALFCWELDRPGALTWKGIQEMDGWLPAHALPLPSGEVEP